MKVLGLDGRTHNWDLTGRVPLLSEQGKGSSLHERARAILQALFPLERILEELFIPGSGALRADFYLPRQRLMVEAHGEQHYRWVSRFHPTKLDFLKAQQRDRQKKDFCDTNSLIHVELPYSEGDEQWAERIRAATRRRLADGGDGPAPG